MAEELLARNYTHFGGQQAETASLTNILRAQGVHAPHNNQPFSEALLLGIGGGLGAGYILWEFKEHQAKILVFGWQNRWNYPIQFYENLCGRINVKPTFQETGSQKAAAQHLEAALANGTGVVAWVDRAQMPYLQLSKSLEGHLGHFIAIYGIEDDMVLVDDLAAKPFRVPVGVMASARTRIGSYKNRLLLVEAKGEPDIAAAVRAGIQDCIEYLSSDSDSFSIPTFQKWGKMMTHKKNAKGWPVVFADRRGLYGALKSVYEGIELISTGGGGMRGLYADFLDEAAVILDNSALKQVATQYRSLGKQWSTFADTVLPDAVEPLKETRQLLRQRYEILMAQGGDGVEAAQKLTDKLNELYAAHRHDFPMNDAEIDALFGSMGEGLLALYESEKSALSALQDAFG
jgi:hypothetical protein